MAEGTYFRSWKGDVVHLPGCEKRGRRAVQWDFADGMSRADVVYLVREGNSGIRSCTACWPDGAVADSRQDGGDQR